LVSFHAIYAESLEMSSMDTLLINASMIYGDSQNSY
jgi:hypothetical protein